MASGDFVDTVSYRRGMEKAAGLFGLAGMLGKGVASMGKGLGGGVAGAAKAFGQGVKAGYGPTAQAGAGAAQGVGSWFQPTAHQGAMPGQGGNFFQRARNFFMGPKPGSQPGQPSNFWQASKQIGKGLGMQAGLSYLMRPNPQPQPYQPKMAEEIALTAPPPPKPPKVKPAATPAADWQKTLNKLKHEGKYKKAELDALAVYGIKEANWLSAIGTAGKWMGRAGRVAGVAPGLGTAIGGTLGGLGGVAMGLSNGEGWRGALARGGVGAVSGMLPFGAGLVAGYAGDRALDGVFQGVRNNAAQSPAVQGAFGNSMGGLQRHFGAA